MPQPVLTIFTAPKSFTDPHIITIQSNALRSWQALGEDVEIIVMGNDAGIAEICHKLGVRHVPEVVCNTHGTPLVSSMVSIAREMSTSPFLGIVNADIILFPDVLTAVLSASGLRKTFLMVGQRWDLTLTEPITGGRADFLSLKDTLLTRGVLHPPMGSDYFIFPRGCYQDVPEFAIGRAGWDNWFIYKSRREGWPVIDCTLDVDIVHQNHDYRHLPGGQPHYRLPETKENVIQGGGEHTIFTLFDAQFDLVRGKLRRKNPSLKKILREIEIFPLTCLRSDTLGKAFYWIARPRKVMVELKKIIKKGMNRG